MPSLSKLGLLSKGRESTFSFHHHNCCCCFSHLVFDFRGEFSYDGQVMIEFLQFDFRFFKCHFRSFCLKFTELIFIHDVCVCAGIWRNCGYNAVNEDGAGFLNALACFVDLEVVDETFIARSVAGIGLLVDFLVT